MSCSKILDAVYEYSGGEPMPLLLQIQVGLHTITCPSCAQEIERFEVCRDILREDFLPSSPGLEDSIMAMIAKEEQPEVEETFAVPGGLSTRGWVIAGLIILISLTTVFFGMDFNRIAREAGNVLFAAGGHHYRHCADQLRCAFYRQPPQGTQRALWVVGLSAAVIKPCYITAFPSALSLPALRCCWRAVFGLILPARSLRWVRSARFPSLIRRKRRSIRIFSAASAK